MATTTPVVGRATDLKHVYGTTADGGAQADWALDANGDLAMVSGPERVEQDVYVYLLSEPGANPLDPTYGNIGYSLIGRPGISQADLLEAMVTQAAAELTQRHQEELSQGQRTQDEVLLGIDNVQITPVDNQAANAVLVPFSTVRVSFTAHVASGASRDVTVPPTPTTQNLL